MHEKKWKSNVSVLANKAKEAIGEGRRESNRNIYKRQLKDIFVCTANDLS